jgi:hypothetical protein
MATYDRPYRYFRDHLGKWQALLAGVDTDQMHLLGATFDTEPQAAYYVEALNDAWKEEE